MGPEALVGMLVALAVPVWLAVEELLRLRRDQPRTTQASAPASGVGAPARLSSKAA